MLSVVPSAYSTRYHAHEHGFPTLQDFLRNLWGQLQAVVSNLNTETLMSARCDVQDAAFVALSLLFFVVSIGYVVICDRLMK
jgi:hypothetical protein